MSKEELMEYVGNEIKKYEERIKNLSDEYFLPNEYESHLMKDGYFKGRKDSYSNILEKLKEEDDKEELNKKKYYIKVKFYLKGGVVIEKIKEKYYRTLEDAKYERSRTKSVIGDFASSDNNTLAFDERVIIPRSEFVAVEIDIVEE